MKQPIRIHNAVELTAATPVLIHYVHTSNINKKPIGCIVAVRNGSYIQIGWSACSPKDTFTKSVAKQIAIARAIKGSNAEYPAKSKGRMEQGMKKMVERSINYFADCSLVSSHRESQSFN